MFFYLSKIFWILAKPLNLITGVLILGLILYRWKRDIAQKTLLTGISLFLICGLLPIGYNMMVFLERQYQRPESLPKGIDGIIVLGGTFNEYHIHNTGMMSANSNLTRMSDFIDLALQYPQARLIFSGGSGKLLPQVKKEADSAKDFMNMMGMDKLGVLKRTTFESNSRNSYENVIFSKNIMQPKPEEKWIVITSAYHMPRVVGIFQQADWRIIPYPSGPKTNMKYRTNPFPINIVDNFSLLHTSVREFIGLAAYYFSGKSAFLFPRSPLLSTETGAQHQN